MHLLFWGACDLLVNQNKRTIEDTRVWPLWGAVVQSRGHCQHVASLHHSRSAIPWRFNRSLTSTSPRSIGFCVVCYCVSSSSTSSQNPGTGRETAVVFKSSISWVRKALTAVGIPVEDLSAHWSNARLRRQPAAVGPRWEGVQLRGPATPRSGGASVRPVSCP